jgi:squalene-associated FAD-dependent desaturase
MPTVHVIGGGLSGLSAAVRVARSGLGVVLYEAAGHAGGRCRSFLDDGLGCVIDNGNHMLLGGNTATKTYLAEIDVADAVTEIAPAAFPFVDFATGQKWRVRPGSGLFPVWLLDGERRVAGSPLRDYGAVLRLARATASDTVADCVGTSSPLYERLWQPLSRAVLNTDAAEGSARLLWRVVAESFLKGEAACRPLFFHRGLSPALVDPAIRTLAARGCDVRLKARVRGLSWRDGRVSTIRFAEGMLRLADDDCVVLAVPPDAAKELWPDLEAPSESRAIVNAHFRVEERVELPWGLPFLGLIGSESQWVFVRGGVLSVTISAADRLVDRPAWELANLIWSEVSQALGRNVGRVPPWRIIKERRATMAQTPAEVARRAPATAALDNLFVAGDWTATGLPATIEGSIRSGFRAAELARASAMRGRRSTADRP